MSLGGTVTPLQRGPGLNTGIGVLRCALVFIVLYMRTCFFLQVQGNGSTAARDCRNPAALATELGIRPGFGDRKRK